MDLPQRVPGDGAPEAIWQTTRVPSPGRLHVRPSRVLR